jgi:hypothetical protein
VFCLRAGALVRFICLYTNESYVPEFQKRINHFVCH